MFTPVSRHLDLYYLYLYCLSHSWSLRLFSRIPAVETGTDKYYKKKTLWIERLNATYPPGINEVQSYKPFLLNICTCLDLDTYSFNLPSLRLSPFVGILHIFEAILCLGFTCGYMYMFICVCIFP